MPYTWYYSNTIGARTPFGSRARGYVYPGAVCPSSCSFGRVHGAAAARGSVTFKGTASLPVAAEVIIQTGQSVFYGIAVKGTIQQSSTEGNNTTFDLVDYRDRLHDVNHFAQYNMVDN